jgi:enolase-phosphatase E1
MLNMFKLILSLFLLPACALLSVEAIVTDIEGTTTSISFVHDVLFPYAKAHVRDYVISHQADPEVAQVIKDVKETASIPDANLDQVIGTLSAWMDQDKKITPLKTLQGLMWKEGYDQGKFQGHLYLDAFKQLMNWYGQSFRLYVYSSGSVQAQKLLFSHTTYGDITPLFYGYFDTKVGGKREAASYLAIASQLKLAPEKILFLSDTVEELNAARDAGMQTIWVVRDGVLPLEPAHKVVRSFADINPSQP